MPLSISRGVFLLLSAAFLSAAAVAGPSVPPLDGPPVKPRCDSTVRVPAGFCAILVAEDLPAPRHIAAAPNGDLFAASNRGGVIALRDTNGDGRADLQRRWGRESGTGIALEGGFLYFAANGTVYRWPWAAGQLEPAQNAEVVVDSLPTGGHTAKPIAVHGHDLYVDIGSATRSEEHTSEFKSRLHLGCRFLL